ncbi:MAG: hypothetical protein EBT86_06580 [Actinobacteria bacterium]|nr:hypothetical protein [Actinomycetota bacterium]
MFDAEFNVFEITFVSIMLGLLLASVSILILVLVLYGQQRRESFTNMRGAYPKWIDILEQVRKILDAQFEYDAMKFAEISDKQTEFSSITGEDINSFMSRPESKFLPEKFKLNIDMPVDSRMAMLFAKRGFHVEEMKKPVDKSKLVLAYTQFYETQASGQRLKSDMIAGILKYCNDNNIIQKLKEKSTFSLL